MKHSPRFDLGLTVVVGLVVATLFAPATVSAQAHGIPPLLCGDVTIAPGQLFHFDKIIFRPIQNNRFVCPANSIEPDNANPRRITDQDILDIKVLDDPSRVADVRRKVAAFLNSLGCQRAQGGPIFHTSVEIIDVEYAVGCGVSGP